MKAIFSLVICVLTLFIPIAEAKTEKVPNAKTAKTATEAVPLEKFRVSWDDMPPKQKKLIRKSLCSWSSDEDDPCPVEVFFYLYDLNDDGIKDLFWEVRHAGSHNCYYLSVYMGSKTGYHRKKEIEVKLEYEMNSCQRGVDPKTGNLYGYSFYDAQDKALFVLNSKHRGMRDLLFIVTERQGMKVYTSSKILKYAWEKRSDGTEYSAYY